MARLGSAFDPNQHEEHRPRDPLPPGWYVMTIAGSDVKQAQSTQNAAYLQIDLEVDENYHPSHKGAKAWERLNLWHPNADTVRIAKSKLTSICKAAGHMRPVDDTEVLHGRKIAVKLKLRPAEGQYEASNDVTGYDSVAARFPGAGVVESQRTPPPATQPPTPTTPQSQQGGAPPAGGNPGQPTW